MSKRCKVPLGLAFAVDRTVIGDTLVHGHVCGTTKRHLTSRRMA
jgi:hypothetical protein